MGRGGPLKYEVVYADTADKVSKVVAACRRAADRGEPIGFDTEFYGVDVGKQSCFSRARLHLCSVAVKRFPRVVAPRGYDVADAAVLTKENLRDLQEILEGDGAKVVHNLPVDAHTLANEGIKLNGGINTLAMARWAWPGRARGAGFTLDSLGSDLLGVGKTESFSELFQEEVIEYRSTFRTVRFCECQLPRLDEGLQLEPCRKRSSTPGHSRIERRFETQHPKVVVKPVPLESVGPGHVLWERAVKYAAQDAVLALAVYDLALREMQIYREVPWLNEKSSNVSSSVPGLTTLSSGAYKRSAMPPPS